jgi:hypothetical protein
VELKGMRKQSKFPNFMHDQIDFMYQEALLRTPIPSDEDSQFHDPGPVLSAHWRLPIECQTVDVREGTGHQRRDGKATLKTGSLLYAYARDRIVVGAEHLFMQGWDEDVDMSKLGDPLPVEVLEALADFKDAEKGVVRTSDEPKPKRRKPYQRGLESVLKQAARNAMVLPDIGLLQLASLIAVDNPALWEKGPSTRQFDVEGFQHIVIDPNDADLSVINSEDECEGTSAADSMSSACSSAGA